MARRHTRNGSLSARNVAFLTFPLPVTAFALLWALRAGQYQITYVWQVTEQHDFE